MFVTRSIITTWPQVCLVKFTNVETKEGRNYAWLFRLLFGWLSSLCSCNVEFFPCVDRFHALSCITLPVQDFGVRPTDGAIALCHVICRGWFLFVFAAKSVRFVRVNVLLLTDPTSFLRCSYKTLRHAVGRTGEYLRGPVSPLYAYLNPSFSSLLSPSITPSLFHSELKTYLFGKLFLP